MKTIRILCTVMLSFVVLSCTTTDWDTAFDKRLPITTDYPVAKRMFYDEFLAQGEMLDGMSFTELGFYVSDQWIDGDLGNSDRWMADNISGKFFTAWIGGLSEGTEYYVRAFGVGIDGKHYLGDVIKVITSTEHIEYVSIGEISGSGESVNARTQKVTCLVSDFGKDSDGVIEYGAYFRTKGSSEWTGKTSFYPGKGDIKENVRFDVMISDLDPETEYEYCVYARNNRKEQLSNSSTFKTAGTTLPKVCTFEDNFEIATTKIVAYGSVEDNGNDPKIEVGFYFGSVPEELSDRVVADNLSDNGCFSGDKRGLKKETEYYVKAFAKNHSGEVCGDVVAVTTERESIPKILAVGYTYEQILQNVTENSIKLQGFVESDGGLEILSSGVYWGTSPDKLDNKVNGELTGEFKEELYVTIEGLKSGDVVFYRFFSENSKGEALSALESIGTKLVTRAWENAGVNVEAGLPNHWIRLSETQTITYYEQPPVIVTESDGRKYKYYFLDRNLGATRITESPSVSGNLDMMGSIYIYSYPKPSSVPSTGPAAQAKYGYLVCAGHAECQNWNDPEFSPCPDNYSIPTVAEWKALIESLPESERNLTGVYNLIKVGKTGRRPKNGGIFQKTIQYASLFCADRPAAAQKVAVFQARDTDSDSDFSGAPYITVGSTDNMINNGVGVQEGTTVRCFRKMEIFD